jgi:hypothetical protein
VPISASANGNRAVNSEGLQRVGYPQGDELIRVRPHPGAAGQFDDRVGREVVARALVPARTGERDAPF